MPTISVDLNAQQATRLAVAIGKIRSLTDSNGDPRPANMAEAKQEVIGYLRGLVSDSERHAAIKAITDSPFEPT